MTRLIRSTRGMQTQDKSLHKELRPGTSKPWNLSTKLTFSFLETLNLKHFTRTLFCDCILGQGVHPSMLILGHVRLFVTPWTVAHKAPLSIEFSRQEYWSGLPFPPPGDLPDPGIKSLAPLYAALQADSLPTKPSRKPWDRG